MKDDLLKIESQLLVMAAQQGNPAALEKLVNLWHKKLWNYVFRFTNDVHASWDITQQCWLDVLIRIEKTARPEKF